MKAATALSFFLLCVLLAPSASAQLSPAESAATRTVTVDWSHEVDFSQFHTFSFEIPADRYQGLDDVDLRDRIMQSISAVLSEKGLERRAYAEEYDLIVAYGGDATANSAHPELRRLTVWITATDVRQGVLVWRGTAEQNLVEDEEQNRAIGRALIAAMLEQWPKSTPPSE